MENIFDILEIQPHKRTLSQLSLLLQQTNSLQFFKNLTSSTGYSQIHEKLCRVMRLEQFSPTDSIITFGSVGDKFYIILQGVVGIFIPQTKKVPIPDQLKNRLTQDSFVQLVSPLDSNRKKSILVSTQDIFQDLQKFSKTSSGRTPKMTNLDKNYEEAILQQRKAIWEYLKKYPKAKQASITVFKQVSQMKKGEAFGQLALITQKPRAATIKALDFVSTATISKKDFKQILEQCQKEQIYKKVSELQQIPIFSKWSRHGLLKIQYYIHLQKYNRSQRVFNQNQEVKYVYFVKQGEFCLGKSFVRQSKSFSLSKANGSLDIKFPIKNAKKYSIKSQIPTSIKGKNEIIGNFQVLENKDFRESYCQCTSLSGSLWYMRKQDFLGRVTHPQSVNLIKESHAVQQKLNTSRQNQYKIFKKALELKKDNYQLIRRTKSPGRVYKQKIYNETYSNRVSYTEQTFDRISMPDYILSCMNRSRASSKEYQKAMFQRKLVVKNRMRKVAPPNFMFSVQRGYNQPQKGQFLLTQNLFQQNSFKKMLLFQIQQNHVDLI